MKNTTLCYLERDGKYLMLYRNKKENDLNEGKWVGVGGKFEPGETPEECLKREVFEETGLKLNSYKFHGIIRFASNLWGEEFMFLYSSDDFAGKLKECDEGEFSWISKQEVTNLPIWEGDKAIFKALECCDYFFTMEVIYEGERLVNEPVCKPSPLGRLFEMQDAKYRDFQAKLIPGIDVDSVIGVRIPIIRKFAKEYKNMPDAEAFLAVIPHYFYDEYLLDAVLVSEEKDYDTAVKEIERLLPYVDNWAVCDIISPKIFKKNKERLIGKIYEWSSSEHIYTSRFGLEMLMSHFLDEDFKAEYLEIPAQIVTEEYYLRMMIAWFFATALAKQWEYAIPYIEEHRLDNWTHNKTIQKARESYRITAEQKEYLKGLRVTAFVND